MIKVNGKLICEICLMDAELVSKGCGRTDCPYRDGAKLEICHLCGRPLQNHDDIKCQREQMEDKNGTRDY
jgi:hypothetical protein